MIEPLPLDQYSIRFAAEPLRERERSELIAHGKTQFSALFENIRFAMSAGFGTKVRSSARSTRAIICVPTQIHATIPEVADVFFSDRTNAAIGFAQSQEIYRLLEPSAEHPLRACGLRWSLWHSPSKLLRQRDICYIEYMDAFVDERGRRGWARCTQSLHHRSCPPLIHSHNIVRAHLGCSGTIYTESDTPGVLDVVTLYDCDTKGLPAWMTKFVAVRKAKNAHLLEHLIRLARAANESMVADFTTMTEVPVNERACFGCGDVLPKWSVSSRKCRECSEPICKSCSDIVYCAIEGGKKLKRICMHCVDRFLDDSDDRRLDMYTDSGSHRSHSGDYRDRAPARKASSASSHRSTRRMSPPTSSSFFSHSSSSLDGLELESPPPMLEDRTALFRTQSLPSAHAPRHASVAPGRAVSIASRTPSRSFHHQSQTQPQQQQPAKVINLDVSRYRTPKKAGDIDLSYLSSFKTASARS